MEELNITAIMPTLVKIMITFEDAEKALDYLKSTDAEAGRAKAHMDALDDAKKTMLALKYNFIESGSAADKLKKAEGSEDYIGHLESLSEARTTWEIIRNKRKSAELQIEMWRSVNSNMRKGNI